MTETTPTETTPTGGGTDTGRLELVAFDAADIAGLASFYAQLTGWQRAADDDDWKSIRSPEGHEVAFQPAPDHVLPVWPGQERPQQVHLDLLVDGIEDAAARAESLGATRLGKGESWITLADPAGHPFDLCQKEGVGPAMGLFAITFDTDDPGGLARFYAGLLGLEVTWEGDEGSMVSGGGTALLFQPVAEYNRPAWPDPARPQQGHLDIRVDNGDAGEALALRLGATRLGGGEGFRVFADPSGHPFCLTTG